jgi:hypothetical protein
MDGCTDNVDDAKECPRYYLKPAKMIGLNVVCRETVYVWLGEQSGCVRRALKASRMTLVV